MMTLLLLLAQDAEPLTSLDCGRADTWLLSTERKVYTRVNDAAKKFGYSGGSDFTVSLGGELKFARTTTGRAGDRGRGATLALDRFQLKGAIAGERVDFAWVRDDKAKPKLRNASEALLLQFCARSHAVFVGEAGTVDYGDVAWKTFPGYKPAHKQLADELGQALGTNIYRVPPKRPKAGDKWRSERQGPFSISAEHTFQKSDVKDGVVRAEAASTVGGVDAKGMPGQRGAVTGSGTTALSTPAKAPEPVPTGDGKRPVGETRAESPAFEFREDGKVTVKGHMGGD